MAWRFTWRGSERPDRPGDGLSRYNGDSVPYIITPIIRFPVEMVQSLLIKLAMLAVTLGALLWIGSMTPVRQAANRPVQPVTVPVSTAPQQLVSRPQAVADSTDAPRPVSEARELAASRAARESEAAVSDDPPVVRSDVSRRIDLNQASLSDLEALPGIGPKLAQRVIEYRNERGPFGKVEDLREVKGIGRRKFDRLRPHVLVTNTRSLASHKGTL